MERPVATDRHPGTARNPLPIVAGAALVMSFTLWLYWNSIDPRARHYGMTVWPYGICFGGSFAVATFVPLAIHGVSIPIRWFLALAVTGATVAGFHAAHALFYHSSLFFGVTRYLWIHVLVGVCLSHTFPFLFPAFVLVAARRLTWWKAGLLTAVGDSLFLLCFIFDEWLPWWRTEVGRIIYDFILPALPITIISVLMAALLQRRRP